MSLSSRPESLVDFFDRTVRRHADLTALEVAGEQLTYGELSDQVDACAHALPTTVMPGARIGLLCERTAASYVGYLAILRAGATVVPLSPAMPKARTDLMCRTAGVTGVLVADERGTPLFQPHQAGEPPTETMPDVGDALAERVAYVLFTSGSTGRPKGVPIRNRNLVPYIAHCRAQLGVEPGSRVSHTFELTFDPSVHDMFVTWAAGGTMVVAQPQDMLTPVRFVNRNRLTHWFSTPSVLTLATRLRALVPGSMPDLRWSLFAGEQLALAQARAWAAAAPQSVVENLYGPTELTITCTRYRLPADPRAWPTTSNLTVPIGRPYPHLEAIVVDDDGHEADEGELCVRGAQRFEGYLPDSEDPGAGAADLQRASAALPDEWYRTGDRVRRLGEELVHVGRLDNQVKINGYRVEPSEVEAVISELAGVREVAVVAVPTPAGPRLHAFYCAADIDEHTVEQGARNRLPPFMVPTRFHAVHTLPTGPHGKLDRATLRRQAGTPTR
ncbi:amino acid adenylation domain-containing protein [Streptomyces sp. 7N604]|uniref:amino acid adenylation domain-containing protein n=1 Tax=Streptomyces sp. 7N604 TaxID=3457415 RepID=UPI003FD62DBF